MHVCERMLLPARYVARPYRGRADHPVLAEILSEYRVHLGDPQQPDVDQIDSSYSHLVNCDPDLDIYVIELDGRPVAYGRTSFDDLGSGVRDCVVFAPTRPDHLRSDLFDAVVGAQETHLVDRATEVGEARFRAYAAHPGPGEPPTGEAAWLEDRGYAATEWAASLVRPHLDDIPDLPLPDGVEVRPARPEQLREIVAAHHECFRGEWDFSEITEASYAWIIDDPWRDETLWQVAWAGDMIVGQVKPFVNHGENAERGYLRGYTEYISTHRDWRNRGIAGALLARALRAIRDRGMTEAALGVDTNNPGGAFQLYTKLGFEVQGYEAVYTRPAP